ncbi:MAG: hypothetical protein JNL95_01775 [Chitinophagales bacterium]|nr:hypothetical protein [Chitinophagales bacterium]
MKKGITIVLTSAILLVSFSKAIVFGAFLLNQSAIAKTLCENRSQPKKHCDGKCYLKKEMTKDEKKDKTNSPFSVNDILQEFVWVNAPITVHIPSSVFFAPASSLVYASHVEQVFSQYYHSEIPHPPSIV